MAMRSYPPASHAQFFCDPSLMRRLPPRERQLATIVSYLGEAGATEIQNALPDPISNPAVRSMLCRLEAKGVLVRYRQGRKFLYALARVNEPGEAALRKISREYFSGSLAQTAAAIASLIIADATRIQR